jgi:hypothetical protein
VAGGAGAVAAALADLDTDHDAGTSEVAGVHVSESEGSRLLASNGGGLVTPIWEAAKFLAELQLI